jgi:hypothetical protein
MPLYEGRHNAENKIKVKQEWADSVVVGPSETCKKIAAVIAAGSSSENARLTVAFDGWYGVEWEKVIQEMRKYLPANVLFVNFSSVLKPIDEVDRYKQKYIGDDPSFGYANLEGKIIEIVDREKLAQLQSLLNDRIREEIVVVYGSGAFIPELADCFDLKFYFDFTRQPLLWKMWEGELMPFA